MTPESIDSALFRGTLRRWLEMTDEILLMIRFSRAAGSREFQFFSTFAELEGRLSTLPPQTSIIAFRKRQLPLRGVVDDEFIQECLESIPDGVEYLITETTMRTAGLVSWYHNGSGTSRASLLEDLEECRGASVAVGPYPEWLHDSEDVVSAIAPEPDGTVTMGIY